MQTFTGRRLRDYPQSSTLKLRLMLGWAMKTLNHTCQPSKDREQRREQELPEVRETQRGRCAGSGES